MRALDAHSEYLRFTFVRNPYDRLVSYYLHGLRHQRNRGLQFYRDFRECLELSAELLECKYPHPGIDPAEKFGPCRTEFRFLKFPFRHCRRQTDELALHKFNISGDAGKCGDNAPWPFIGRFENLEQDFHHLQEILHLPRISLPHENDSEERRVGGRRRHYSEHYDAASRRMVEELYADDLELLGYEYEQPGAARVPAPLYDLQKARQYKQRFSRKERWIFLFQAAWCQALWRMRAMFPDSWFGFSRFRKLYGRWRAALLPGDQGKGG